MPRHEHTGADAQRSRLAGAAFLILAGVVLFLANLGFLPVEHVWNYWPLIFVAIGLGRLSCRRPGAVVFGAMLIILGAVFTLINTGMLRIHMHDGSWPLSLLFLALGIGGLAKVFESNRGPRDRMLMERDGGIPLPGSRLPSGYNPDLAPLLNNYTVLGSVKRKLETLDFQGGSLNCVMGQIEIDLRRAKMPDGAANATIDVGVLMGSIELRIPETWRVTWVGDNLMSSIEDRTIPPNTGTFAPQLVLTGSCIMGSVQVES